jgi:hypothetical protein
MTTFTIRDIQQIAEVPYGTAHYFLTILRMTGYLKKEARKGGPALAKWQLIKDTGPQAPRVTTIYLVKDLNTGEEFEARFGKGQEVQARTKNE